MKSFIRAGILLCCASLMPLAAVANAKTAPQFIAESARAVPGGRSVQVVVSQPEINAKVIESSATMAMGGGLLPALIDAAVEAERTKKANAALAPIHDSLVDFDGDGLALATTTHALANVDWMKDSEIKFSKDASPLGKVNFLDAGDAAQGAFFEYTYQFAPNFSSLRVIVNMQFVNKGQKTTRHPEQRLEPKNLAFSRTVTSVIQLPSYDRDIADNAKVWAADDAKLTKEALALAFANAEKLMTRTLALNEADIKTLTDPAQAEWTVDGEQGVMVEKSEGHIILWTLNGFMQADKLAAAK